MKYAIEKGPRGGQYYIDNTGKKHYIKRTNKKFIEVKETKKEENSSCETNNEKYIGRFSVYNEKDELVDDFKEWTWASSESEALAEFRRRYPNIIDITVTRG